MPPHSVEPEFAWKIYCRDRKRNSDCPRLKKRPWDLPGLTLKKLELMARQPWNKVGDFSAYRKDLPQVRTDTSFHASDPHRVSTEFCKVLPVSLACSRRTTYVPGSSRTLISLNLRTNCFGVVKLVPVALRLTVCPNLRFLTLLTSFGSTITLICQILT